MPTHELNLSPYPRAGFQPLAMRAHVPWRFVVNFRVDAVRLAALLPTPLVPDLAHGFGFVSVCVLHLTGMRPLLAPTWLGLSTTEMLLRASVKGPIGGQLHRGFYTFGSDLTSRLMHMLSRSFSHYRPRHFAMRMELDETLVKITAAEGCLFSAPMASSPEPEPGSIFPSLHHAVDFVLGMDHAMSVDRHGRLAVQEIVHPPWQAGFVRPIASSFPQFAALGLGPSELGYDSTLLLKNQAQVWKRMQRLS